MSWPHRQAVSGRYGDGDLGKRTAPTVAGHAAICGAGAASCAPSVDGDGVHTGRHHVALGRAGPVVSLHGARRFKVDAAVGVVVVGASVVGRCVAIAICIVVVFTAAVRVHAVVPRVGCAGVNGRVGVVAVAATIPHGHVAVVVGIVVVVSGAV